MSEKNTDLAIAALSNSGVDTSCGACMEVAFTGVTTNAHTCRDVDGGQVESPPSRITTAEHQEFSSSSSGAVPEGRETPGWQDISTAPKDGTRILVHQGGLLDVATYIRDCLVHKRDVWMVSGGFAIQPTHWMPLPPVPGEPERQ
jgi:hypothetical protein